ncbi:MAG: zinc-ribbon domain-containing protein, partial [Anaeromyxobacteraceae bacterium]
MYELDDRRLPARGALVKCTRCQHVFRAAPPAAAPASPSPPAGAQAADVAPEGAAASAPAAPSAPTPDEKTALFGFSGPGQEEKTEKLATAPPPLAGAPGKVGDARTGPEPKDGRGDGPGGGARVLWVVLALLLLVALLAGVWLTLRKRPDPAAAARRAVLEHLLARDDRTGLEQAGDIGSGDLAGGSQAQGALALALLAADAADELRPLEARERAVAAELAREESLRASGWRDRRDEIAGRLAGARGEAGALRVRTSGLLWR